MAEHLTPRQLAPRILAASTRLLVAQRELSAAMAELATLPSAEVETIVSERLRSAFAEVTAAKQALASLVQGE
jgi:hypothetical protein